jgi:hypothetical protein
VHHFCAGEGTNRSWVGGVDNPGHTLKLNCSLKINVRNPSTMFGIHASSSSTRLMYSEIAVTNGQVTSRLTFSYKHQNSPTMWPAVREVLSAKDKLSRGLCDPARREDAPLRSRRYACSVQRRRQGAIDARTGRQKQRVCDGVMGKLVRVTREACGMPDCHRSRQLQANLGSVSALEVAPEAGGSLSCRGNSNGKDKKSFRVQTASKNWEQSFSWLAWRYKS